MPQAFRAMRCGSVISGSFGQGRFNHTLIGMSQMYTSIKDLANSWQWSDRKDRINVRIHFLAYEFEGVIRGIFWDMDEKDWAHNAAVDALHAASNGKATPLYGGIINLFRTDSKSSFNQVDLSDYSSSLMKDAITGWQYLKRIVEELKESGLQIDPDAKSNISWKGNPFRTVPYRELDEAAK